MDQLRTWEDELIFLTSFLPTQEEKRRRHHPDSHLRQYERLAEPLQALALPAPRTEVAV